MIQVATLSPLGLAANEAAIAYRDDPGDPARATALIAAIERLIGRVATISYRKVPDPPPCLSVPDLVQEGRIHALRVAAGFDPERSSFSHYLSRCLISLYGRIIGRELRRAGRFTDLNGFEDDPSCGRTCVHESWTDDDRRGMLAAAAMLPGREKEIVARHYLADAGEAATLSEMAADLGVSKQRVGQIEARAIRRMRRALNVESLTPNGDDE